MKHSDRQNFVYAFKGFMKHPVQEPTYKLVLTALEQILFTFPFNCI